PSVQVGDPFTEKLLVECCLAIFAEDLVVGIQDLGAAGISCAVTELASAGSVGMRITLDDVPLRDATLAPEEILMSESQERMCAVVEPAKLPRVLQLCQRWGVLATPIGEVTDTGRVELYWRGEQITNLPPASVAHDGPVYDRPAARPADLDALQVDSPDRLARPSTVDELRDTLLRMVGAPNLASKRWVTDQYDRYVQGNTALAQPHDAGVIRVDAASGLGVAVATDGNGRYCRLDPYAGAQLALAEAFRNVAAACARPLAVTDCLNFGSPEDPAVMWQFIETVRGLADGCQFLGTPVTGGNVSFYNQTGATPINPTPVIGVVGVLPDVARRTRIDRPAGCRLLLLGVTRCEFGGSEWAWHVHGHLGGRPPAVDLGAERALARVLVDGAGDGVIAAAHDLSDGGLAQALIESCLAAGVGARIALPAGELTAFDWLFSESAARAIVAVTPGDEVAFADRCTTAGVPAIPVGETGGDALDIDGSLVVPLAELRNGHDATLPALFG
ncbi:MAG: AIR synthase-related protein, partial [Mycobacteriales bacterium]